MHMQICLKCQIILLGPNIDEKTRTFIKRMSKNIFHQGYAKGGKLV